MSNNFINSSVYQLECLLKISPNRFGGNLRLIKSNKRSRICLRLQSCNSIIFSLILLLFFSRHFTKDIFTKSSSRFFYILFFSSFENERKVIFTRLVGRKFLHKSSFFPSFFSVESFFHNFCTFKSTLTISGTIKHSPWFSGEMCHTLFLWCRLDVNDL